MPVPAFFSLRWHYPNQVTGRNEEVSSQPASASSPFRYIGAAPYGALLLIIISVFDKNARGRARQAGLFHELSQRWRPPVSIKEATRPLRSRMPLFQISLLYHKKSAKNPCYTLDVFFSIDHYQGVFIFSSIKAFYWLEDIPFEQFLVIIEKIHHLTDGGSVACLDLHKAKDIQCKLPDQRKIVSGSPGW